MVKTEYLDTSYLALPDGAGPFPGVVAVHEAFGLNGHPQVDAARIGAIGFCLGGSIVLTWACTDARLAAIAPFYGTAPKPREAIRRLWPARDFTTKAARVLETELTAAAVPHDLKLYPGPFRRRCGSTEQTVRLAPCLASQTPRRFPACTGPPGDVGPGSPGRTL